MKAGKIALFFAIVVAALAGVSVVFPSDGIAVGKHTYYLPTLGTLAESWEEGAGFSEECGVRSELMDSIQWLQSFADTSDLRFWLPDSLYLDAFWQAAESAAGRGTVLRVLHYGDSQIEMDRMSAQLRTFMQETFGGGGPGLIPFRTVIPSYAVRQSTSGELAHLASFGDSTVVRSKGNYGPMMQCFRLAGGSSTATVTATNVGFADSRVKRFSRVRLIYNNRGDSLRLVFADREGSLRDTAGDSRQGVGSREWMLDSATSSFSLRVSGSADLYGIAVDDGAGVAVDNIPMRGCSGPQFTTVNSQLLAQAYGELEVGLIILQFGGNSVPYIQSTKAIENYCEAMGRQIDYIHRCCPQARILFVGPSDMSTRVRDQLQTYPFLPALVDSLAATATRHHAAYWSIYHAMGGFNAMVYWNRKGWAIDDYIHFSHRGAEMMGDRLVQALKDSYHLYRLRKRVGN